MGNVASSINSYSVFLNGTNQYLTVPSNTVFQMSTGDFTIEAWVNLSTKGASSAFGPIIDMRNGTAAAIAPVLYTNAGTIRYYTISADRITGTTLSTNIWNHVALVRISGVTTLYLNGATTGSTYTDTNSYIVNAPYIGRSNDGTGTAFFSGYISNLRIVKGVGVYTGAFTVPSPPLAATQSSGTNIAAISGTSTSLLTAQSNTIVDTSTFSATNIITNNGAVPVIPYNQGFGVLSIPKDARYLINPTVTTHKVTETNISDIYANNTFGIITIPKDFRGTNNQVVVTHKISYSAALNNAINIINTTKDSRIPLFPDNIARGLTTSTSSSNYQFWS